MLKLEEKEIRVLEILGKRRVMRKEEFLKEVGEDGEMIARKLNSLGYIDIVDLIGSKTYIITKKGSEFLSSIE